MITRVLESSKKKKTLSGSRRTPGVPRCVDIRIRLIGRIPRRIKSVTEQTGSVCMGFPQIGVLSCMLLRKLLGGYSNRARALSSSVLHG